MDANPSPDSASSSPASSSRSKTLPTVIAIILSFIAGVLIYEQYEQYTVESHTQKVNQTAAAAQTLVMRAVNTNDIPIKRELYSEVVAKYGDAPDSWVQNFVALARSYLADLAESDAESAALYQTNIDQFKGKVNIHERISLHIARSMIRRALLFDDQSKTIALLDETIDYFKDSPRPDVQSKVLTARYYKAKAEGNIEEQNRFFPQAVNLTTRMQLSSEQSHGVNKLVLKAQGEQGKAEKKRLLEEIIDKYQDHPEIYPLDCVTWAILEHTKLADEPSRNIALYDTLINKYKDIVSDNIEKRVEIAVSRKLKLLRDAGAAPEQYEKMAAPLCGSKAEHVIPDILMAEAEVSESPEEKIRLYDMVIAGHDDYGDDSLPRVIKATMGKAALLTDKRKKIALYDWLIEKCLAGDKKRYGDEAINAAMAKADILDNDKDKLAVYDAMLARSIFEPSLSTGYRIRTLLNKKVELLEDPAARIRYYDEVIAANRNEAAVVNALFQKALTIKDEGESLRVYSQIIDGHWDSGEKQIQNTLLLAAMRKADQLDDTTAKIELYDRIIAKARGTNDKRHPRYAAEALRKKANLTDDREEKLRLLDELIARHANDKDGMSRRDVEMAIVEKGKLTDDPSLVTRYYDETIAKADNDDDIVSALEGKARGTKDREEKIRLYDEIIQKFGDKTSSRLQKRVLDAYLKKAETTRDKNEKLRQYNVIIEKYKNKGKTYRFEISSAYKTKAYLIDDAAEKVRVYDEMIAYAQDDAYWTVRALLGKAGAVDEPAEKIRIYDSIIDGYGTHKESTVLSNVAEAIMAKAKSIPDKAGKIALYDRIIDTYGKSDDYMLNQNVVEAIEAKVRLTGDNTDIIKYYDKEIAAATGSSVIMLMINKAAALTDNNARRDLYEEVIQKYGESDDPMVKRLVQRARRNKDVKSVSNRPDPSIRSLGISSRFMARDEINELSRQIKDATDKTEKLRLNDDLIALLEHDPLEKMQLDRALLYKAELTDDKAEKIAQYDRLIDNAKKSDEDIIGFTVLTAIREKSKLTDDPLLETAFYDSIIADSMNEKRIVNARMAKADAVRRGIGMKDFLRRTKESDPTPEDEEAIALYREIIEKHGESESVKDLVTEAYMALAELIRDKPERIRLYDTAIERYRTSNGRFATPARGLSWAYSEKMKITEDPADKLRLADEQLKELRKMSANVSIINDALLNKAELVQSPNEKIDLYRQIVESNETSNARRSSFQVTAAKALAEWAKMVDDKEEKVRLYDRLLDMSKNRNAYFGQHYFQDALKEKARLLEDSSLFSKYYDEKILAAENDRDAASFFMDKAKAVESPEDKMAVYDAFLARFGDNGDSSIQFHVANALLAKGKLVDNIAEKNACYDRVVALFKDTANNLLRQNAVEALIAQCEIAGDDESKKRLYRQAMEILPQDTAPLSTSQRVRMLWKMVDLVDNVADKIAYCDEILSLDADNLSADNPSGDSNVRALLKKASLLENPAEQIHLYDEIIAANTDSTEYAAKSVTETAILAKVDLVTDHSEKLALLDQLETRIRSNSTIREYRLLPILRKKAQILGDNSPIEKYYDEKIAEAEDDYDRYSQRLNKAWETKDSDTVSALAEEIFEKYRDGKSEKEVNLLLHTLRCRVNMTEAANEKVPLYDEMIRIAETAPTREKLGYSILSSMNGKAEALSDPAEKIRIYDAMLEKVKTAEKYLQETWREKAIQGKAKAESMLPGNGADAPEE